MTEREHIPIQIHEYVGEDKVLYQGHPGAAPTTDLEPSAPPISSFNPELTQGGLPPPPSMADLIEPQQLGPPPIIISPERLDLLDRLDDYRYSRFAKRINGEYPGIFDDLRNAQDEDLRQRLEVMETFVAKRGLSKQAEMLFRGGLSVADSCFQLIGWDVEGASELIANDEDMLDIVEEMRIKWRTKNKIQPEYRLAVGVFSIYAKMNGLNKAKKSVGEALRLKEAREKIDSHLNTQDKGLEERFKEI